jgi:hypothetical protein
VPVERRLRPECASLIAAAVVALAEPAAGAPQANLGLTAGGALTDLRAFPRGALHMGARGDVLFFRTRNREMGVGPYVDVGTIGFETIEVGGGVAWLVPVVEAMPFVLSAGIFERRAPTFGWEPGVSASLFVGVRSFNFAFWYGLAAGVFVQGRYGLGDAKQADVVGGAQVDLSLLAYPFVLAYEALRR